MSDAQVIWDLEDDLDGNVQHIAQHGVTMDEVEQVLLNSSNYTGVSNSTGYPITIGYTEANRKLLVVWEHIDDNPLVARPITAYDID